MKPRTYIPTLACLTIALMLPAATAGGGGGGGNLGLQVSVAEASTQDAIANDADVYQGGGSVHSAANCQWVLAVSTLMANIAAADGLGLIADDDSFTAPGRGAVMQHETPPVDRAQIAKHSTATCEQDWGNITVSIEIENGWGDPAPQGGELAGLISAQGGTPATRGMGNGGGNALIQIVAAGASIDDVIENDYYLEQDGNVLSAANCQAVITWRTLIVNAGLASGELTISDEDSAEIRDPPPAENGPAPIPTSSEGYDREPEPDVTKTTTSSCRQHADSITLMIGKTTVRLPPSS